MKKWSNKTLTLLVSIILLALNGGLLFSYYNFYLSDFIIYPYGNQMTWFEFYDKKGNPFRDIYTIGIDTKYKDLTFNLSHFCSHFVRSDYEQYHRYNDVPLGGRLTKISVRYDY